MCGGPLLGGDLFLDRKAIQGPEPKPETALSPLGSQRHRDRAVVRRGSAEPAVGEARRAR